MPWLKWSCNKPPNIKYADCFAYICLSEILVSKLAHSQRINRFIDRSDFQLQSSNRKVQPYTDVDRG